jgi:hypothetical protein
MNIIRNILLTVILFTTAHANAQVISTVAGAGISGYTGDGGQATAAKMFFPAGVAFDGTGNYFIADEGNNVIRKVNNTGIIITIAGNGHGAGTGTGGYLGDGGPATAAEFYGPTDLALDAIGNLYIADEKNKVVRKIDIAGNVSTIAGTGIAGYNGDGGLATLAELDNPTSVVLDAAGNIFIADQGNHVIRQINNMGIINTYAGTGTSGYSGDGGPAAVATFNYPTTLAIDKHNNLYISDQDNNCVRKVNTSGIINTIAGTGAVGYGGDGSPATSALLNNVSGVGVDTFGNIYIGDGLNHVIRKVNTSGIISTIAGVGTPGYSGDGGPATACKLRAPWGVKTDIHGNVFIADLYNHVIRKITLSDPEAISGTAWASVTIYPNPASTELTVEHANGSELVVYDVVGREVKRAQITREREVMDVSGLVSGVYVVQISKDGEKRNVRVVKE